MMKSGEYLDFLKAALPLIFGIYIIRVITSNVNHIDALFFSVIVGVLVLGIFYLAMIVLSRFN